MGSNRPVKMADNLPAAKKPTITKAPVKTIKVPGPAKTPTPK